MNERAGTIKNFCFVIETQKIRLRFRIYIWCWARRKKALNKQIGHCFYRIYIAKRSIYSRLFFRLFYYAMCAGDCVSLIERKMRFMLSRMRVSSSSRLALCIYVFKSNACTGNGVLIFMILSKKHVA